MVDLMTAFVKHQAVLNVVVIVQCKDYARKNDACIIKNVTFFFLQNKKALFVKEMRWVLVIYFMNACSNEKWWYKEYESQLQRICGKLK